MDLEMQQGRIEVAKDVLLDYRIYGSEGDFWVIANGYGASYDVWEGVLPEICKKHRVLMWDYRGTFQSSCPEGQVPSLSDHIYDLHCLMDAFGIERPLICGWSVGVQVALEFERAFPDRVRALILHNGASDHLFHRMFGGFPGGALLLSGVTRAMPYLWSKVGPILRALGGKPGLCHAFCKLGLLKGEPERFVDAYNGMMNLDMVRYSAMAQKADRHDIASHLSKIAVPVLVTAGSRDVITPPKIAREICEQIPNARFELLKGNTHYAVMESPERVAEIFEAFWKETCAEA